MGRWQHLTVPLLLRPHLRLKWRCRRPRWGSQFSLIRCTLMIYDMYFTVENTPVAVAFRPVHKLAVVVVRKRLPSLPRLVLLSSPPSSFLVLSSPTRLVFLFSARTARHARSVPQAQLTYLPPSLSLLRARRAFFYQTRQTDGDDVAPLSRLGPTSGFLRQVTAFGHLTTDDLEI